MILFVNNKLENILKLQTNLLDRYLLTLRQIKDRAEEFIAQHRVLGLPEESELAGSDNVVHVESYTRSDGTEVKAHWRSKPNSGSSNNEKSKANAEKSNNDTNTDSGGTENVNKAETKYTKPVEGKITSDFGYRIAPMKGASTGHSGIDIGVPVGTPVKSIADGTVIAANGGMRGYGNGVFVDHGIINGKHVVSEYGHLSSFDVKVGDKVTNGQVIAKSGNTGISTGPHLHLTIRENKEPVDPKKYLGKF